MPSTGHRRKNSARLIVAGICLACGAALVAWPIARSIRSRVWQEGHAARVEKAPVPERPAPGGGPIGALKRPRRGEAIARLRIPRVGLDSVIAEGTDLKTLARGPGHMEGTALPGDPDNCIIAGHRDGEFARLGKVREGDVVELVAGGTRNHYRVTAVSIVDKDDTSVLKPADGPLLTLITCYPFRWTGPAPRRLIVRGELIPGST
jgi:sortase A